MVVKVKISFWDTEGKVVNILVVLWICVVQNILLGKKSRGICGPNNIVKSFPCICPKSYNKQFHIDSSSENFRAHWNIFANFVFCHKNGRQIVFIPKGNLNFDHHNWWSARDTLGVTPPKTWGIKYQQGATHRGNSFFWPFFYNTFFWKALVLIPKKLPFSLRGIVQSMWRPSLRPSHTFPCHPQPRRAHTPRSQKVTI